MALTNGAIGGAYTPTFIGAMDIEDVDIRSELIKPFGDEGAMYLNLMNQGAESMVSHVTWSHFEKDLAHTNFKVKANNAGGSANAETSIELHADSIDANGKYYPRFGDVVMFKGGVKTRVTEVGVTAGTIKVKPLKTTDTVPATLNGETVAIIGSAFGDGAGAPSGAKSTYSKYSHQTQIFKEAVSATGGAMTTSTYLPIYNKNSEYLGTYSQGIMDGELRLLKKMETTILVGEKNTSATANTETHIIDADHAGKVLTTTSLHEATTTRGGSSTYGSWTDYIVGIDDVATNMFNEYVKPGTVIWADMGMSARSKFTNDLYDIFSNQDAQYLNQVSSAFGITQEAAINFDKFSKSHYTFAFNTNFQLSDPQGLGSTGYTWKENVYFIPLRKMKSEIGSDDRKIPNFGIRYKGMSTLNRRMIVADLSGVGATLPSQKPTHEYDVTRHIWMADIGAEFMAANALYLLTKS